MRTIIDIQNEKIKEIKQLCERQGISRAELIRRSIDLYLQTKNKVPQDVFGILKNKPIDGLVYQHNIREEW
jgi:hypothetical protein